MRINEKDYVVMLSGKNKRFLALVTKVEKLSNKTEYTAIIDNSDMQNESARTEVTFEHHEVIANLGRNPFSGRCFNVSIEPFFRSKKINPWGVVSFYRDMTEDQFNLLTQALKTAGGVAKQRSWFPPNVIVEVRNPKGKFSGSYRHTKKDDTPDILTLSLKDEHFEDLPYVINHELGHGVWFTLVSSSLKSKWISLYTKSTVLSDVTKLDLISMRNDLIKCGSCGDYFASVKDDEAKPIMASEVFKFINRKHKLSKNDLDILLEDKDVDLTDIFPLKPMQIGSKSLLVSEYATKSVTELFAESFAFFILDRELPKEVKSLMKETLASV